MNNQVLCRVGDASSELVPIEAIGLSVAEAAGRLAVFGPNELVREAGPRWWRMLGSQLASPLIALILAAAATAAVLHEIADAIAIVAIVVVNAIIGFLQEFRAERAVLALRAMTAPRARVIRDGRQIVAPATEVVPGDLLVVEAGDLVAADAQLVEAHALAAHEALLTGESEPAGKATGDASERRDRIFMGTAIASGTGRAVVTATGMATELGKIAKLVQSVRDDQTPLQRRLAQLARTLLVASLGVVAVVAIAELAGGFGLFDVFLSAVSLAVAAVPEGLPAIVTIALALGVRRMAARHALVRKLPAVETLGCATVICTDKTGTLTTGVMTVRELWGPDHRRVLEVAASCCDAELGGVGDPTELALLAEAARHGITRTSIEIARPRVDVTPFDPDRKRMSILRADRVLYVKGAVEEIVARCTEVAQGASDAATSMAMRGLRVLAIATGEGPGEADLTLTGLIGLADPPREAAARAIEIARAAGIETVMITGDHPATARAIARELGLDEELVHARAMPEEKLRIVRDWKARGAVVAMTGDGVNDAPALREAHVGIAMGKTGTEVTREVSDIVLADDNFASIVAAVREGRGIFDNIRKALVYLLAGNAAELATMLIASLAGLPLPLLPLHLLWINLVTDGLPALALVMDPPETDVMARPPRPLREPILGAAQWKVIGFAGVLETLVTLAVFVWALGHRDVATARSLAFTVLVLCELFKVFAFRSTTRVFWRVGVFTNMILLGVIAASVVAQLAILQITAVQHVFTLGAVSASDVVGCIVAGLVPVTVLELAKLVRAARRDRPSGTAPRLS